MIQDSALAGNRHPRRQLPAGLLPILLEAARRGDSELTIAICDQLAPTRSSNSVVLHHASIPACIRAVCYHCPPSTSSIPVVTMSPDVADRAIHTPEAIGQQWRTVIDESWPSWTGVPFTALDRNEFYDLLPSATAVVHTLSEEPYANVLLRVQPSQSRSLLAIPRQICPKLAHELSIAGHSNAVAIVPRSMEHVLSECSKRALRLDYTCTSQELASILSGLWLPDTHVQHPAKPLQCPLGLYSDVDFDLRGAVAQLSTQWRKPELSQALTLEGWSREVRDTRVVATIVAHGSRDDDRVCYLMKNWISGFDGGF